MEPEAPRLEDIASDPKTFCEAVLNSREFRQYVVRSLTLGSIPPAVLQRMMDIAGWPVATKRKELTGADGKSLEPITEVRRVVVRPHVPEPEDEPKYVTH